MEAYWGQFRPQKFTPKLVFHRKKSFSKDKNLILHIKILFLLITNSLSMDRPNEIFYCESRYLSHSKRQPIVKYRPKDSHNI